MTTVPLSDPVRNLVLLICTYMSDTEIASLLHRIDWEFDDYVESTASILARAGFANEVVRGIEEFRPITYARACEIVDLVAENTQGET